VGWLPKINKGYKMSNFNVLVSSVPKCGTYLGAAVLKSIGFIDQELHVYNGEVENYRNLPEGEKIKRPVSTFKFDLVNHLRWSKPGTFVVGHPGFVKDLSNYLCCESKTKAIYMIRDLREAAISQMRFLHKAEDIHDYVKQEKFWNMDRGPDKLFSFLCSRSFHEWLKYAHTKVYWLSGASVLDYIFLCRYEHLIAGHATTLEALAAFLEVEHISHSAYLYLETRTLNGVGSSKLEDWDWGKEHDRVWEASGANLLNTLYERV
jgi:hypothetical protein